MFMISIKDKNFWRQMPRKSGDALAIAYHPMKLMSPD